jgi:hypothetical protein
MKNDINKKRSEVGSLSHKRHTRTRVCDLRTRIGSADSTIQKLKKNTRDYVDGEDFDEYL